MTRRAKRSLSGKKVKNTAPIAGTGLMAGVFDSATYGSLSPLSFPFQLSADNQYNPLTLNRILLSYAYMTHGVLQTAIDQPVEDAFRGGIVIQSDELDPEDIALLQDYLEECKVIKEVKDVMKWSKLFGGGGLIINTDQDPKTELNMDAVNEKSPLSFIAADRWELTLNYIQEDEVPCPYNYYGQPIHKSRVIKVMGKEAPSFIRKRLQGWGMSEVERMIRDINQYVKNQDVIYELLDEAKIDIWHVEGFNSKILSSVAQNAMSQRLSVATMLKNYHRALVMDKNDDYEQKQITFSGLAEMLQQIRIGIAAALRMPMTKVFGLSASGFNSGEDDIENYNALIDSEVRAKAKTILTIILPLCCQQVFGFNPEHLSISFKPLRVLSAEQEENVKNSKFNRASGLYSQGILSAEEYCDQLKQDEVLLMDTEVGGGFRVPEVPEGSASTDVTQKVVKEEKPEK